MNINDFYISISILLDDFSSNEKLLFVIQMLWVYLIFNKYFIYGNFGFSNNASIEKPTFHYFPVIIVHLSICDPENYLRSAN